MASSEAVSIHIGYPKAASTYLQTRVFPCFPEIQFLMLPRSLLRSIHREEHYEPERFRAQVFETLKSTPSARKLIISHELLSGHPHGYPLIDSERIARRLSQAYPQGKILVVIRDQFEYLLSLYAFRVVAKGLETRPLAQFVREEAEKGLTAKLCYDRLLGTYMRSFSAANVLVLPVEMLRSEQEGFLRHVSDFVGTSFGRFPAPVGDINRSTRVRGIITFTRLLNVPVRRLRDALVRRRMSRSVDALRWNYYSMKRRVLLPAARAAWGDGRKIEFPPDIKAQLNDVFGPSNTRLCEMIRSDLRPYGYLCD